MEYSKNGLELTEHFEGCRLVGYLDAVGVPTVGYGHTGPGVYEGMEITQEQAQEFLEQDVESASDCVNRNVTVPINQNEFDALTDFAFNEGNGAFEKSTLLKYLNGQDYAAAASEFYRWVYAGGHRLPGLVERRKAEHDLFVR